MFSVKQKRKIANEIQTILRDTKHPELPEGEINFMININGAVIRNNGVVDNPSINPWNEKQDKGGG